MKIFNDSNNYKYKLQKYKDDCDLNNMLSINFNEI